MIRFVKDSAFLNEIHNERGYESVDVELVDEGVLRSGIPKHVVDAKRPINIGLLDLVAWRIANGGKIPDFGDGVEVNCIVPTFGNADSPGCIRLLYEWACDAQTLRLGGAQDFPTPRPKFLDWAPGQNNKSKPRFRNLMAAALGQFLVSGLSPHHRASGVTIYSVENKDLTSTLETLKYPMAQRTPLPTKTSVAYEGIDPVHDVRAIQGRAPDDRDEGWHVAAEEPITPFVVVDTNCVSAVTHHYAQVKELFVNPPGPSADWRIVVPSIAVAEMAIHSMWPVKEIWNEQTKEREVAGNWQDWKTFRHVGENWFLALEGLVDLRDQWDQGPVVVRDMSRHAAELLGNYPWPQELNSEIAGASDLTILASCVHPQGRKGERKLAMGRLETRDKAFREAAGKVPIAFGRTTPKRLFL